MLIVEGNKIFLQIKQSKLFVHETTVPEQFLTVYNNASLHWILCQDIEKIVLLKRGEYIDAAYLVPHGTVIDDDYGLNLYDHKHRHWGIFNNLEEALKFVRNHLELIKISEDHKGRYELR